jgi:hypothetical protein
MPELTSVPHTVAWSLATLSAPSRFEAFVAAYGDGDRARDEWEHSSYRLQEEERRREAEATLEKAKAIAAENGWDWAEVERLAHEQYPELFK